MKFVNIKNSLSLLLGLSLILSLAACPKRKLVKKTMEDPAKEEGVDSEELDIHGKDFISVKDLASVHFDYDSNALSSEARQILSSNAEYLKRNAGFEVLVEGHCDERGTVGYNLALGQKRAQTVRKYYISLGIKAKRIGSLSFGKEKPACHESSDECWTQNRRAETKVRAPRISGNRKSR